MTVVVVLTALGGGAFVVAVGSSPTAHEGLAPRVHQSVRIDISGGEISGASARGAVTNPGDLMVRPGRPTRDVAKFGLSVDEPTEDDDLPDEACPLGGMASEVPVALGDLSRARSDPGGRSGAPVYEVDHEP